jgi:hypothetical protein
MIHIGRHRLKDCDGPGDDNPHAIVERKRDAEGNADLARDEVFERADRFRRLFSMWFGRRMQTKFLYSA